MLFTDGILLNLQGFSKQRLRQHKISVGLVDFSEIIQSRRIIRMLLTQSCPLNFKCLLEQWFGAGMVSKCDVKCSQVVQAMCKVGMLFAKELSANFQ